jgi:phage shock protein A
MASQKQLEAKYRTGQNTADDWLRRAELAVQKGEDELAKEALKRRKSYQEQADSLKMQLEQQQKAVDQLMANTRCVGFLRWWRYRC